MVTMVSAYDDPKVFYGLSTDTKPDFAPNGSLFIEMDTSKILFFSEEGSEWLVFGETSSGGSKVGTAKVGTAEAG